MDQSALSQDEINRILQKLKSPAYYIKLDAVQELCTIKASDTSIVEALISILVNDADTKLIQLAKQSLLLPVHQAVIKQHPELAKQKAEHYRAMRAQHAKQRAKERTLGILARMLAFIAAGIVIWGIAALPLVTAEVHSSSRPVYGQSWDTTLGLRGSGTIWICVVLVGIAVWIGGRQRGWWWIGAGVSGLVILWFAGQKLMVNIVEAAAWGMLPTYTSSHPSLNFVTMAISQTVGNMALSTGFYVSTIGLILLMGSGVWDIVQKGMRKSDTEMEIYEIDEVLKALEALEGAPNRSPAQNE